MSAAVSYRDERWNSGTLSSLLLHNTDNKGSIIDGSNGKESPVHGLNGTLLLVVVVV